MNLRRFNGLLVAMLAGATFAGAVQASDISGAGATFPYPIYAKWADAYKKETGIGLNYQSIGSGGGIKQITENTVDFGASDMPMKPEDLQKAGLMQFPTVIGGDVPVYNLKGVAPGEIRFSGPLIADIYLGKISKWSDPAIAKLNPGKKLPDSDITVVHRSDGSGTTFIWTSYLSKVSSEWKEKAGEGTSVSWPTGVGGKGNEGVASYVQRIDGAIGYLEYAYVLQNKMSYGLVSNREAQFVTPSAASFQAAAAAADWKAAPGMYLVLTDAPGKAAWPIAGATFILMHTDQRDAQRARDVLKFFSWAYAKGGKLAAELDYVPMPDSVVTLIEGNWKSQIKASGAPVWPAH